MRCAPSQERNNKRTPKYLSPVNYHHHRRASADYQLPQRNGDKQPFKISLLLKHVQSPSMLENRPTTGSRKKRQYQSVKRSFSRKDTSQNISFNRADSKGSSQLLNKKNLSVSNTNNRYKDPLKLTEDDSQCLLDITKRQKKMYSSMFRNEQRKEVEKVPTVKIQDIFRRGGRPGQPSHFPSPKNAIVALNPPEMQISRGFINKNPRTASRIPKCDQTVQPNLKYTYRTRKGFMPNNPGKVNQDSYVICPNIRGNPHQHYFGVCDGHGTLGLHVSAFVKLTLMSLFKVKKQENQQTKEHIKRLFQITAERLARQSSIDITFSGTTCVGCYILGENLFCCNVGDSRAVMGRRDSKGQWTAIPLSNDHKPTVSSEIKRILKAGGRVESFKDKNSNDDINIDKQIGPLRIWLQEEQAPGLAMTRSLGDAVAASVGVSSEPEITQFMLTSDDRFLLIGTDGIWQFLENEKVVSKLGIFYDKGELEEGADWLLSAAKLAWKQECSIIDDITFILVFLGQLN